MKATETLHNVGQSLWLDNITRDLLTSGTLKRYIETLSITGLTSNPTIFDHAISKSTAYDHDIRAMTRSGVAREDLFFRLAIADLQQAADLLRLIHNRTAGVDGWVSLEVSPLLAMTRADGRCREFSSCRRGSAQSVHQDPWNQGGRPGDRGSHFQGRADQRHAAFLARTIYCCSRGVHGRPGTPDRVRIEPGRPVGCVTVHQPLGQGDDG